jgi:hypothetical protein
LEPCFTPLCWRVSYKWPLAFCEWESLCAWYRIPCKAKSDLLVTQNHDILTLLCSFLRDSMVGFCNGLGLVIALAQFNTFKVPELELEEGERRLSLDTFGAFGAFTDGRPWVDRDMLLWMIFHIIVTIAVYIYFPKLTKHIPGSLAGIIASTILEWAVIRPLGYETNTVEDLASVNGKFPVPVWIDETNGYSDILPEFNGKLIAKILPTAITVAVIGLLESLLTLEIIDELTNVSTLQGLVDVLTMHPLTPIACIFPRPREVRTGKPLDKDLDNSSRECLAVWEGVLLLGSHL